MPVVRFSGEGKRRGEWGVKRGSATPFLEEEGTPGRCARVLAVALAATPSVSRRGRRSGGAHTAVRGEGGGWADRRPRPGGWAWGEGGGQREEEGSGPMADHMVRAEKEKEAGLKPFLRLKSNRVKENQF
jgi:hypothetical protein